VIRPGCTEDVRPRVHVGDGTRIWHQAPVRAGARVGVECILGKGTYIDEGVLVGDRVKIQHSAYCGPVTVPINDQNPRALCPEGSSAGETDLTSSCTRVPAT
jgi:UDP-2-acetamido-3-amino-2,3-dideoxy-glucuronate N-acetyltransferase